MDFADNLMASPAYGAAGVFLLMIVGAGVAGTYFSWSKRGSPKARLLSLYLIGYPAIAYLVWNPYFDTIATFPAAVRAAVALGLMFGFLVWCAIAASIWNHISPR